MLKISDTSNKNVNLSPKDFEEVSSTNLAIGLPAHVAKTQWRCGRWTQTPFATLDSASRAHLCPG